MELHNGLGTVSDVTLRCVYREFRDVVFEDVVFEHILVD